MKRLNILFLLLMGCFGIVFSQSDDSHKREKMIREVQEFKMKYLAQEMELSELQKKKFFELYEEMEKSKMECYKEARKKERELKASKNATDQEYQQVYEAMDAANSQWAEIEKKYNEQFAEFLTSKQMYKMKEAEKSFKMKLDEMRHNRRKGDHHKMHKDKSLKDEK